MNFRKVFSEYDFVRLPNIIEHNRPILFDYVRLSSIINVFNYVRLPSLGNILPRIFAFEEYTPNESTADVCHDFKGGVLLTLTKFMLSRYFDNTGSIPW